MRLLRTAFGNRGIARLEAGAATTSLGAWTFSIVLALYAYYEGGPGAVALAVAARMLPAALVAPLAERIVSGYAPRTVLAGTALARFALLEAIALVVANELPFALLLVLAAAFETAAALSRTAREALLIDLARTPAELALAGVRRIVDYAGFLAGALAAGALLVSGGLDTAFAAAGVAFLAAAVLAWRLPGDAGPARPRRAPLESFAAAALTARSQPGARLRLGLFGASALVQSMLELLLVVTALDVLGMNDGGVGWLRAAFAAGGLAGGALAVTLLAHGRVPAGLAGGMVLAGVPLTLLPAWPEVVPAVLLLAVVGGGYALLEAALAVLTQRTAAAAVLARVEDLVYPVARAAGTGLAAWLVVQLGEQAALVVAGVLLPALAVASIRSLTDTERRTEVPERATALLRALPLLGTMPAATLENLALCAAPRRFAAGETVLRERVDRGRFHVIEDGEVELSADGEVVERLGAGDSFGDRALLFDAPSGVTATALTPVSTLTLARTEFVSRAGSVRAGGAAGRSPGQAASLPEVTLPAAPGTAATRMP